MGAGSSTAGAGNSKSYPSSHPVRPVYFRENRTVLRRFIPAGAGNTHRSWRKNAAVTVYPRWRGERSLNRNMREFVRGLSPLARGTLLPVSNAVLFTRFIPAGAGNTPCA